jgi:hypothetical protein
MPQVASGGTVASNSARLYSKDVAGTAEMFVKDEAGNETQISPHSGSAPDWFADKTPYGPDRIICESNIYTGRVRYTNETRRARLTELMLDAQLGNATTLEKLQSLTNAQKQVIFTETFTEHNTRLNIPVGTALVQRDWTTEQQKQRDASIAKRDAWLARKAAAEKPEDFTEPEPSIIEIKPAPSFLAQ